MECKVCKRVIVSSALYPQRYCSTRCRTKARNARRRQRYLTSAAYREKCKQAARAYYHWHPRVQPA